MDPARLARWWGQVLGLRVLYEKPDEVALPGLVFIRSAEMSTGPDRLRLELDSDDLVADVERLVDMGARHVGSGEAGSVTLADPEGNRFCVLPPRYSS